MNVSFISARRGIRLLSDFIFLSFLLTFTGCKKSTAPATFSRILLEAEYISITEVQLFLQIDSPTHFDSFQLLRDKNIVMSGPLHSSDTTLTDTLLQPAQSYTYQALVYQNEKQLLQSSELTIITLDTTSHHFDWQIYTIGNSPLETYLYDVSIINENDIWVVGEIIVRSDSNLSHQELYNAVHWNGREWEYHQIYLKDFQGNDYLHFLTSVLALSPENVWVHGYIGAYGHWDGTDWEGEFVWEMTGDAKQIWGTSSQNLYFAGDNGNITYFDGQNWLNMNSKTTIRLTDIFGYHDPLGIDEIVYACGFSSDFQNGIILVKPGDEWMILDNGIHGPISSLFGNNFASIWTARMNVFYVTSFSKAYKVQYRNNYPLRIKNILSGDAGIYRIRGNDDNDIFVVGDWIKLRHFNGLYWHHYDELDHVASLMKGLDIKGNIVVVAGLDRIIIGKRSN